MADKAVPFKEADGTTIDNADATSLTVAATTVLRPRLNLADPTDAAGLAKVENTRPGASDYGVVTRPLTATDGTHDTPTMDAVGRPGFVKVTDGANTMPTMDAPARPGFVTVTDFGTHTDAAVTDATNVTTAATLLAFVKGLVKILADVWNATSHFLKVSITDGTNTMPTGDASVRAIHVAIDADNTAAIANPLPVQLGDGTNVTPTGDVAARAIIVQTARGAKTAPSAVSVTTTATQLIAANTGRRSLLLINNGSATVYLGNSAVTTANGIPLAAGASIADASTTDAWYAIGASGTNEVRVLEVS